MHIYMNLEIDLICEHEMQRVKAAYMSGYF